MPSATIAPKYGTSASNTFALRSSNGTGCEYAVAGRALSKPYAVVIQRKVGNASAKGNDHVIVTIRRTETPAAPLAQSPVTGSVSFDISIPRDTVTITGDMMNEMCASMSSLLNDYASVEDTLPAHGNILTLIGGSDL